MADQAVDDDDIYVYRGGNAPHHVINAIIHQSIKKIDVHAFCFGSGSDDEELSMYEDEEIVGDNVNLRSVIFHDGVEEIEVRAFGRCVNLLSVKLPGVRRIKIGAFRVCQGLRDVEFGDKLDTISDYAFYNCLNLTSVTALSLRSIGEGAFINCESLTDAVFGEALDSIENVAFSGCSSLKRIAIPLKNGLFDSNYGGHYSQFNECCNLDTVDLVGGVHKTVASLHHESWRNEMREEINRINHVLPRTSEYEKGNEIMQWIQSVNTKFERFKAEHMKILKEATTLLELALWKANLDGSEGSKLEREGIRTTGGKRKRARKEICVASGANTVIELVLPFLQLE